jgi:hypothetical protein
MRREIVIVRKNGGCGGPLIITIVNNKGERKQLSTAQRPRHLCSSVPGAGTVSGAS